MSSFKAPDLHFLQVRSLQPTGSSLVFIKEIISDALFLIFYNGINIDVLDASEDIGFYKRIRLLQFCDQFLCFNTSFITLYPLLEWIIFPFIGYESMAFEILPPFGKKILQDSGHLIGRQRCRIILFSICFDPNRSSGFIDLFPHKPEDISCFIFRKLFDVFQIHIRDAVILPIL